MDKPPRPFERGVESLPTVVSNVETLANLPFINRRGAVAFRSVGTAASAGTFLATISGGAVAPALYEVAHGVRLSDLLTVHGADISKTRGVLMGGYFAGFLGETAFATPLDHDSMSRLGSGLGCGAIGLITEECPLAVAACVLDYFDRENAGQCGSCFNGTAAMAAAAIALREGHATADDVERLRRWSALLRGRGACGTLDAACNIAATMLDVFPAIVDAHLTNDCSTCLRTMYRSRRPFEIEPDKTL
jgi:NADH:ubiquinone oxidoreductase subunit F (NADH-binding)